MLEGSGSSQCITISHRSAHARQSLTNCCGAEADGTQSVVSLLHHLYLPPTPSSASFWRLVDFAGSPKLEVFKQVHVQAQRNLLSASSLILINWSGSCKKTIKRNPRFTANIMSIQTAHRSVKRCHCFSRTCSSAPNAREMRQWKDCLFGFRPNPTSHCRAIGSADTAHAWPRGCRPQTGRLPHPPRWWRSADRR